MSAPYPRARKRFGQHFLEPAWVARLVMLVDPKPDDTFLEIGAGRGALTRVLAPRAGRVIAIEIDRDLAAALPATVPANVTVVEGDFLEMNLDTIEVARRSSDHRPASGEGGSDAEAASAGDPDGRGSATDRPLRVIGNLPYNISSPILFKLLTAAHGGRRL